MKEKLREIRQEAVQKLEQVRSSQELEELRVKYLGK